MDHNFNGLSTTFFFKYYNCFICKLNMLPLMCAADKAWITELTLIYKNIRSLRNSHAQELTQILKIIKYSDLLR